MTEIKIKPIEVSKLGLETKIATQLNITSANVNLIDNGVTGTFHLTNEIGECVYNDGHFNLTNEEVVEWVNTDEQLLTAILLKLKLEKAIEEVIEEPIEEVTDTNVIESPDN